jgi:hypothetical protein
VCVNEVGYFMDDDARWVSVSRHRRCGILYGDHPIGRVADSFIIRRSVSQSPFSVTVMHSICA